MLVIQRSRNLLKAKYMLIVYIHTHYLNFVKIRYGLFTLISNLINKAIGINLVQRQMYFVTYYINQNTTKTFFFNCDNGNILVSKPNYLVISIPLKLIIRISNFSYFSSIWWVKNNLPHLHSLHLPPPLWGWNTFSCLQFFPVTN